ncbi:hypothetical protein COY07_06065 [Candidatus Peregrinibacteria bacterium CG_4_10_14_0_2_um_filter_43_11]|nr:MAG: hypothetical protein COY07_06065 [Candidatus Peregrinibacteria bacterium CG_4_10_14_0_2_um_filter_43_11]
MTIKLKLSAIISVILIGSVLLACSPENQQQRGVSNQETQQSKAKHAAKSKTEPPLIPENNWGTYINNEYSFELGYPKTLWGNEVQIDQIGDNFFIKGKRAVNWNFEVPFTIGLNIETEKDLDQFLKEKYGKECELSKIYYDKPNRNGLYPVEMKATDASGDCWVNWIVSLQYSPEKKKIVAINLGQEPPLVDPIEGKPDEYTDYNKEIIDRFNFIN